MSKGNSQFRHSSEHSFNGGAAQQGAFWPDPSTDVCSAGKGTVFWRVEGSLLDLSAVRAVGYFTWNAQSFLERWARRGAVGLLALVRPLLYATDRVVATRALHALLRGVSRDRLDSLGEEYFQYVVKSRLKPQGVEKLRECLVANGRVILVSQALEHVMRPLAQFLGVGWLVANRLEFRDGRATGRLVDPVIRPRGALARLADPNPDGRVSREQLERDLGLDNSGQDLNSAVVRPERPAERNGGRLVAFDPSKIPASLSVRETLAGKSILLVGVTGFIGKVWLASLLREIPQVGKIVLLIRRQRTVGARRRFEKIVEESPVFDQLHERHGSALAHYLAERIEVVEGDVSQPDLGLAPETRERLQRTVDLVVNSSGLVEFNPDLREALATNVAAVVNLLEFVRGSDHAALLHLSTCYAVGRRDGRVAEELSPNYTPRKVPNFDAQREWQSLQELVKKVEERSESPELTAALRLQVVGKRSENIPGAEIDNLIRRNRARWLRNRLIKAGSRRGKRLGWPNTYTFTKSLAESLIVRRGRDLPIAVVRPSIVETSIAEPFCGWNEGVNTSAPLSYLLGTYFRQLPTNERKCLDIVPVDLVCRGLTLIGAALVRRCHQRLDQLATSATNPCDMRRSIELTGLAHRKHYRAQQGLEHWLRSKFDTIPVSKSRYQRLSVPAQKALVRGINRIASPLLKRAPLARQERDLTRVEKLIELYEPFILYNDHVFEAENVQWLSAALPPEEREIFGYDPARIDWWEYWINIHIPALRKWCYPLIEGRSPEGRPGRTFRLPDSPADVLPTGVAPPDPPERTKATWPSL